MSSIPVTVRGAQMMRDELQRLKTKDRYEVIAAIAEARSHGDLSENAEYDAAATVSLEDLETGEKVRYQIVGNDEADLKEMKISITSPLARALIGREAGDVVEVNAPAGVREYEILDVLFI